MTSGSRSPRVEIEYCKGCRWGLRAGWLAQELLATFEAELGEIALLPGREGGVFAVRLDGELLFDRRTAARFPELRELKQAIRDRIAPGRPLGHSDRPAGASAAPTAGVDDAEPS
ncbi:MAG: SelT/SelW/SelH family protein [Deltaproteobacteria bacterium]|nr:SelT/SelW/SelH family protein [Deltaproteobacteria bacterium]